MFPMEEGQGNVQRECLGELGTESRIETTPDSSIAVEEW